MDEEEGNVCKGEMDVQMDVKGQGMDRQGMLRKRKWTCDTELRKGDG